PLNATFSVPSGRRGGAGYAGARLPNTEAVPLRPPRPSSALNELGVTRMRALIVLVGLVATPFLAGVSQQVKTNSGVGHGDGDCVDRRPGVRRSIAVARSLRLVCSAQRPGQRNGGNHQCNGGNRRLGQLLVLRSAGRRLYGLRDGASGLAPDLPDGRAELR